MVLTDFVARVTDDTYFCRLLVILLLHGICMGLERKRIGRTVVL